MLLNLEEINFHDAEIHRVIENAETKELGFEVMYACGQDDNDHEPRTIVFLDVKNYMVLEGECDGRPTILRADQIGQESSRGKILIQTNFGDRFLYCKSVEVRPGWGQEGES